MIEISSSYFITSPKHYLGVVTPEKFTSYEELYDKFEMEWQKIAIDFVNRNL